MNELGVGRFGGDLVVIVDLHTPGVMDGDEPVFRMTPPV